MFDFIHKLQQKPESARRRFAFLVSLVVTLIVVGVWFTTLPSRTSSERRTRVEEINVTPLRSLGDSFSNFFSGVEEQLRSATSGPEESVSASSDITTDVPATTTESVTPTSNLTD